MSTNGYEWVNKVRYTHTVEYYLVTKKEQCTHYNMDEH